MKLIVGLGNPGDSYLRSRHNIGFMVVDTFAGSNSIDLSRSSFKAEFGKGRLGCEDLIIAKPQTYMNRSGESVASLLSFFKIPPSDCIVICDDIELPLGRIRIRSRGGHGGHNGLRSIIEQTGTDEFVRVKVGIGKPEKADTATFVLSNFSQNEVANIDEAIDRASLAIHAIIKDGIETAMNRFNPVAPLSK